MKDNRDPRELGLKLLYAREYVDRCFPMSKIADHGPHQVGDYRDETTLEKYGDPRLLPSTLPN